MQPLTPAHTRVKQTMRMVRTVAVLFAVFTCVLAWSLLNRGEKLALKAGSEQVERAVSAAETDINRSPGGAGHVSGRHGPLDTAHAGCPV